MPFQIHPDTGEVTGFSFSGEERNRLFFQMPGGDDFREATLVSGIDFKEDGRCFALADFDSDGFVDIGLISTGKPRLRILANGFGSQKNSGSNWLRLRLVGANETKEPSEWSPRDPIGAVVTVKTGAQARKFQYSPFEGLSVQNSSSIHIGLGNHRKVDQIEITWPSGKVTRLTNVPANQTKVVSERALE